jgi:3-oxoacyl-[acyl-carrier-protein] synthase II
MAETVVVTGLGVVSPLNPEGDLERFWASLCTGETGIGQVRSFDTSRYAYHVAAEISRAHLGLSDVPEEPARRMAEVACARALTHADIAPFTFDPQRAGIVVGTVLGGTSAGERYIRAERRNRERDATALAQYPLRAVAALLARQTGCAGCALTVSTACASGTDAIGLAYRRIASGGADLMVAGGVDAICELSFSGFAALKALTTDRVRPFSRNRTGLALGEGAAFLVLESAQAAARRGGAALGEIAGYASRADAVHLTAPHREGRGLAAAATAALRDGGCRPDAIDYVSAHGTGTPYNDAMETVALKAALGDHARRVAISSIKGALGHAFGAAGAMEAATCLLAMRDGIIPPTINLEEPDPACDLDFVPNRARQATVRVALSLSSGFGGQNAALALRAPGA